MSTLSAAKTKKANSPVELFMHGLLTVFGLTSIAFVIFIKIGRAHV